MMKKQLLLILIIIFAMNGTFAQPIIKVWGSEDSLAIKKQVVQYLELLDVREQIYLTVVFTAHMPEKLKGITLCRNSSEPGATQFIKVKINPYLGKKEQELVLAHEMVHVKQYAKGELIVNPNQPVVWKGRRYGNRNPNFLQTPWENEAYLQDNQLSLQWKEYLKNSLNNKVPLTASKTDL